MCNGATKEDGLGPAGSLGWTADERGNQDRRQGGRVGGVGQHGGRKPATQGVACGGGCSKRTGAPEAVGVGQVNACRNRAEGGLGRFARGTAPMRRVHDKADERLQGTWVGRSMELGCQPQRQLQAAELLGATTWSHLTNLVQWAYEYLHRYFVCREESL